MLAALAAEDFVDQFLGLAGPRSGTVYSTMPVKYVVPLWQRLLHAPTGWARSLMSVFTVSSLKSVVQGAPPSASPRAR